MKRRIELIEKSKTVRLTDQERCELFVYLDISQGVNVSLYRLRDLIKERSFDDVKEACQTVLGTFEPYLARQMIDLMEQIVIEDRANKVRAGGRGEGKN